MLLNLQKILEGFKLTATDTLMVWKGLRYFIGEFHDHIEMDTFSLL